jgi:Na+-transporting methylmalonyl-CoA/oxaloacetate decarboxylase gamma subunit
MKKYILLFVLVFAMAGITNAQTTEAKSTDTKVTAIEKADATQKTASAEKVVTATVAKSATCKDMSKGCCKKGNGQASASTEKACCANMAEAKEGKACCDKKSKQMKAETKKEASKKG